MSSPRGRKLRILAAALLLSAVSFTAVATPADAGRRWEKAAPDITADIAGPCSGPAAITNQKYVGRHSSYIGDPYFDKVSGIATARLLEVCIGYSSSPPEVCGGGTWVLPANVAGNPGVLYQLGYGRCAGENSNYVVWTVNGTPHVLPNPVNGGRISLVDGHKYRFTIYKRSTGRVSFDVYDLSAGNALVGAYYPSTAWSSSTSEAFWLYETIDDASEFGHSHGDGDFINMYGMVYNGSNDNVDHFRQPSAADVFCSNGVAGTPGGCSSNVHAHIKTTTYTSDTFDVDTD